MRKTVKRIVSLLLTMLMVISIAPLNLITASASCYSDSQLSGVKNSIISNSKASNYVNTMMAYYLKNVSRLKNSNLDVGKSVVFLFDGCSSNVYSSGFDYTRNHMTAYCAVVKLVNGVPKIVYENENSSTIPDNPRMVNNTTAGNGGKAVPTVVDGIHDILTYNHRGYAALHARDSGSDINVIRCTGSTYCSSTSDSIDVHARGWDYVSTTTYSSTGCINIGVTKPIEEYNNFIYAVTGKTNAKSSTFSSSKDVGVIVIDRYMYKDTLTKIYNGDSDVVNKITEYSTSMVNEASTKSNTIGDIINDITNKVIDTIKKVYTANSGFVSHTTSSAGVNFIKQFEGLRLNAYKDSGGTWTIGYGHTGGVYSGMSISEAQAVQYLQNDLKSAENAVNSLMKKVNRYLTQEQFDALVSFTFNVGSGWTTDSSYNIYKYMTSGVHTEQQVKETFGSWCHSGGVTVAGLVTRRAKEAALYLYGTYDGTGGTNYSPSGTITSNTYYNPSAGNSTGYYTITASSGVNVRSGAGTNYSKVTAIPKGTQVAITETNGNWGKYSSGWICLDYAVWNGSLEPIINVPAAPSLNLTSAVDMATGNAVTVTWSPVTDADCYDIYLKNSSGTTCQSSIGNAGTSVAFTINDAGKYNITAVSRNSKYTSSSSNTITVTAHSPSTVTFVDWNGTVISKQTIPYNSSATVPANPSRYGWTFKKWDGNYSRVTSNQTITAYYERNVYTVTFFDEEGTIIGEKQKIEFESSATAPKYTAPEGYTFLGWDKEFNYIESNLTVNPVIVWSNDDLPIVIQSATTAVRESSGYTVNVSVKNNPNKATDGRIIVALKTTNGKLLSMTESAAFHLKTNETKTIEVYMPYDRAAVIADVYAVEKFSTAIPISAVKSLNIDQGTAWTNWSTTAPPSEAYQVERRTEYRYRTKSTTTSTSSSLSGWTKYNTTSAWGNYGSWSNWTDTKITASDSRQVETRQAVASYNYKTVYHYYRYANSSGSAGSYDYSSAYPNYQECYLDSPLTESSIYGGFKWWYNGSNYRTMWACADNGSQEIVSTNYKTQYRYRDRVLNYTYYYYKWSDWSSWSTSSTSATDTKEVETRTTYRYLANDPSLVADNTGTKRTITGKVDKSLAGEQAILFIYKVDEASDFTNEYVGQSTIGSDGSYSFSFVLREEPTIKTGDYTVTLGIEGTNAAIYLDPIEAPKPKYTVTYLDWDGTVLSTQSITKGENAKMPSTNPTRTGYDFICWNNTATNVQDDLTVSPVYKIKTFTVAFVDWTQETVRLETYEYGQPLVAPEINNTDESVVTGWDAIIDGKTLVTSNMVVTAKYDKKTFTVSFSNESGEVYKTQEVEYGNSITTPNSLNNKNVELLGWVTTGDLESVTEDMMVVPIYEFKENVSTPTSNIVTGEYSSSQVVTLSCETENATIFYTLDGTDPLVEGIEYTGPITISKSSELKFVASAFEKNDSEIVRELIAINNSSSIKHIVTIIGEGAETNYNQFFVNDGEKLPLTSSDFNIDGYSFNGLLTGETLTDIWNLSTDTVSESLTLYATWTPKQYTVTYIGFDGEIIEQEKANYLDSVTPPECDAVDGYVFTGFDCDDYTIRGNTTISAIYVPENDYVAISLNRSKLKMVNGFSFTLSAEIKGKNITEQTILWYSADEDVALVTDDGIVTATGKGTTTIYAMLQESGCIAECVVTVEPSNSDEIIILANNGVGLDSAEQIRGISVNNNSVSNVKQMFDNESLVFIDITGYVLEDDDLVGTGTKVRLMDGTNILDEKNIVVTGDMNGDGKINNRDSSMIIRYLVDKEVASLAQLTAIDVNGDGYVNNRDASMVSRYLVGKETL